jgi:hypothetical protein
MENEKPNAAEHAAAGAGVGAAGVTTSVGIIGVSTAIAAPPFSLVIGAIGGLVWWGIKKLDE